MGIDDWNKKEESLIKEIQEEINKENTIIQRINSLIEELPNIRNQAKENIKNSQEEQKL
ncbi:hypothetical protein C1646_778034 [Rhizophagus diaphanus]|nr:hypothetical protein C1646_778034 [Rhizophagus diaphanus] [Rhizophagus sp. MUCL 43196]